jgi:hypothetical protein
LRHVHAAGDPTAYIVPDEALEAFMAHCQKQLGAEFFKTPRNTIKQFVHLLSALDQNPGVTWEELLGHVKVEVEANPDLVPLEEDALEGSTGPAASTGDAPPVASEGDDDDELTNLQL